MSNELKRGEISMETHLKTAAEIRERGERFPSELDLYGFNGTGKDFAKALQNAAKQMKKDGKPLPRDAEKE